MIQKINSALFILVFSFILCTDLYAQSASLDNYYIGASINYNTLHFNSKNEGANDAYSYSYGYQFHVHASRNLNQVFSINSGVDFFAYRYAREDIRLSESSSSGANSNNVIYSSLANPSIFYIGIPLIFSYQFSENIPLRVNAGPKLYYKIGHINGETEVIIEDRDTGELVTIGTTPYSIPEDANKFKTTITLGIGYDLPVSIPITAELSVQHSITPYISGHYTPSWSRGFYFSLVYVL